MVERVEPTMEEIVVALRETTRAAGRPSPFTLVHGRGVKDPASHRSPATGKPTTGNPATGNPAAGTPATGTPGHGRVPLGAFDARGDIASTDVSDLRDAEIERLLADNTRSNERIMFLLKVIEHEQARSAAAEAEAAAAEVDRDSILRDVKAALDAELRPVLLVLQRLLEKQQQSRSAGKSLRNPITKVSRPAAPVEHAAWINDEACEPDSQDTANRGRTTTAQALEWTTPPASAGVVQLPKLRQRMARAFDALSAWSASEAPSLRADRSRKSGDL